MREYAIASPRFWTGETGKLLRRLGRDYQVVGFYLFTCASSNMIGLYYLPLPTLCHEVGGGITEEGALKVLGRLSEAQYAHYDEVSEHVYLPNMAREQLGERLVPKDNRHSAVVKLLERAKKTPFFQDFMTRYGVAYHLLDVPALKPLPGGSGAPSKGQALANEGQDEHGSGVGPRAALPGGRSADLFALEGAALSEPAENSEPESDPEWFADFRRIYPKRAGSQEWRRALRAGKARLKDGHTESELLDGARRYAQFCVVTGKIETEFVKQAASFLGPEKSFLLPWSSPGTKDDALLAANVAAAEEARHRLFGVRQ